MLHTVLSVSLAFGLIASALPATMLSTAGSSFRPNESSTDGRGTSSPSHRPRGRYIRIRPLRISGFPYLRFGSCRERFRVERYGADIRWEG